MAKAVITFTDLDIDAGTVQTDIEVTNSATDDGYMTMAHVFSKFIAHKMGDPAFLNEVYEFAADLVNTSPANESGITEAACAA